MDSLTVLTVLEELGVKFELDWDDSLILTVPPTTTQERIVAVINAHLDQFTAHVARRARKAKACFVGGPFNGLRHDLWIPGDYGAIRKARAHWAVYRLGDDERAFFKGYASSERKARRGELKVTALESRTYGNS